MRDTQTDFWGYMLGDEDEIQEEERQDVERSESFLDVLFPIEDETTGSATTPRNKRQQGKLKQQKRSFWRRGKKKTSDARIMDVEDDANTWEGSFLDPFADMIDPPSVVSEEKPTNRFNTKGRELRRENSTSSKRKGLFGRKKRSSTAYEGREPVEARRSRSDTSRDSIFGNILSEEDEITSGNTHRSTNSKSASRRKKVTGNPFEDRLQTTSSSDSEVSDDKSSMSSTTTESDKERANVFSFKSLLHPFIGGSSSDEDTYSSGSHDSDDSSEDASLMSNQESIVSNRSEDLTEGRETESPRTGARVDMSPKSAAADEKPIDPVHEIRLQFSSTASKAISPKEDTLVSHRKATPSSDDVTVRRSGHDDESTISIVSLGSKKDVGNEVTPLPTKLPGSRLKADDYDLDNVDVPRGAFLARSPFGKVVCCSIKNSSDEMSFWSKKTGIPIHELSDAELAEMFPKLRVVADDRFARSSSSVASTVIGSAESFDSSRPAHLQLSSMSLSQHAPQSLYEYEFETGRHMGLFYERFGHDPRSQMKLYTFEHPPETQMDGLFSFNPVVIQVEASTISYSDCLIRQGEWWGECSTRLPNTPGVDFVGKIFRINNDIARRFGLRKGDRVMSLVKWGGNSRYITCDPAQLVKISDNIDPALAVCLAETYLVAFQALHHGQGMMARYKKNSLKGKSILLIGDSHSNTGKAIAQLAAHAQVDKLYASTKSRHAEYLTTLGIIPLEIDPLEWCDRFKGKLDLIISIEDEVTPIHYKLLNPNGEIVVISRSDKVLTPDPNLIHSPSRAVCSRTRDIGKSRTYSYDVFWEWDAKRERCHKDLAYLCVLLSDAKLAPDVIDRLPLHKVARAQELIESKSLNGFLVCEPWLVSKSRAVRL